MDKDKKTELILKLVVKVLVITLLIVIVVFSIFFFFMTEEQTPKLIFDISQPLMLIITGTITIILPIINELQSYNKEKGKKLVIGIGIFLLCAGVVLLITNLI